MSTDTESKSETTRITRKGRVTTPKAFREEFGLEPGDEVIWQSGEEGIIVRKANRSSARGMLVPNDTPPENRKEGIAVDRVVLFMDMQIWDSRIGAANDSQTVREQFDAYRETVAPETSLYVVDLASYGDLTTPDGYDDVYNISGWSENVLEFIEHAEAPLQVLDEIDGFELYGGSLFPPLARVV